MKKTHIFLFIIILFLLLPRGCGGSFSSRYRTIERDTTIYNVTYRDSVVYNIIKKDSVITDYRLVSVTEFDTTIIHDTTYIAIPIASYHFADTMSDIWASGYRVTLDSVRYHFRDVTKMVTTERVMTERPKILTADAGLTLYTGRVLDLDMSARVRLGERWSIAGRAGVFTDGKSLTPYAGAGVRYRLR
jgi:hypothetical protein